MAFYPIVADKMLPEMEYIMGNTFNMQQLCKPPFDDIYSLLAEHPICPTNAGTPDSVLAPPHGNSSPLDGDELSPSPFELDVQQMEFLLRDDLCDGDCNSRRHMQEVMGNEDHNMQEPYESFMYPQMNYVTSPISSVDHQARDGVDCDSQSEEDTLVTAENRAQTAKQQLLAVPVSFDVKTILRQHIKEYLGRELQEELALCGCARVTQAEREEETGENPILYHRLECKMRTDYDIWVMWMHERRMQNDGIDLVQRLLACAEAVACRDAHQAKSLLKGVQELASPYGDSLQRVAFCFMMGLAARLNQHNNAGSAPNNLFPALATKGIGFTGKSKMQTFSSAPYSFMWGAAPEETLLRQEAFQYMCDICPYVRFGHFIANSVILEAVEGDEAIHVIDLGMSDGLQWPALIHQLATRPSGPPNLLRITSIGNFSSQLEEEVGEALHQEAAAASLNFEFNAICQPLESIAAAELNLRANEVIIVNSILRLHCVVKESRGSLNTVLHAIHGLSPKVLTLVEQDANHNGPFFLGRFMEALHYYSAIFDSLQSALPRHSTHRINIEQWHFAQEIRNIVACEGPTRVERHERVDQWRRRMSRAGFQLAPIRLEGQTRIWLSDNYEYHKDDYTLSDEKGCLVLGWKGKPIIAASAWRC